MSIELAILSMFGAFVAGAMSVWAAVVLLDKPKADGGQ